MKEIILVGLDAGATSVKAIVVDGHSNILYELPSERHDGNSFKKIKEMLAHISKSYKFDYLAMTGVDSVHIASVLAVPYIEEIVAQASGIYKTNPSVRTVIDIGGSSSRYIFLGDDGEIINFAISGECAAGTGSFVDQQASRLSMNIEEFSALALESKNPARIAGRCSVFAKSDMIHNQQKGTPKKDICMGLYEALSRSYRSNTAKGKLFHPPIAFVGGMANSKSMTTALKKTLNCEDIFVPDINPYSGAFGAAVTMLESLPTEKFDLSLLNEEIKPEKKSSSSVEFLSKLSKDYEDEKIKIFNNLPDYKEVHRHGMEFISVRADIDIKKDYDVFLGVDIGSVSTNIIIMDEKGDILLKHYLPTAGDPISAVRKSFNTIGKFLKGKLNMLLSGITGSGRYFIGEILGADVIKNEITAHATGISNLYKEVDTIFEIGGQDSKYIYLKKGVVEDFNMNNACAAGTGSFLEEQSERMKIELFKGEFETLAFQSNQPAELGERCTVFMQNSLDYYKKQGVSVSDLCAGLAYSIAMNYLNKVVENRRIGKNIVFQGGTANNSAVVSAFEKIVGRPVVVPPHKDMMGAWGAAILAKQKYYRY